MSTAAARFTRVVSLVAELTRSEREGHSAPTIDGLARRHGVTAGDIKQDIAALTLLGEKSSADWLLSLSAWQQGDHVSIASHGPFRRPVRLTPEEQLAIQVALALEPDGAPLARRFAALWSGAAAGAPASPAAAPSVADTARRAIDERRALAIEYAGEGAPDVRSRAVHPHQLATLGVRTYLVAWAPDANAWRHFRLDRVQSARLSDERFERRDDFRPVTEPRDLFRAGATEPVTVRFRAEVAAWVTESFPQHEVASDGSVLVRFEASSPEWLTRRVLEFGADAEVIAPARYRDAVRRVVAS